MAAGLTLKKTSGGQITLVPEDGTTSETITIPSKGFSSVIQVVSNTVNTMATYSSPPSSQTNIDPMNINFIKQGTNSKVIITWMINGELHQDNVFRIYRNGVLAPNGQNVNNSFRWTGFAAAGYDQNESSTPTNWFLQYIDDSPISGTYQLYVGSSSSGTYTFALNRTLASTGADAYENMVSTVVLMEVAV